MDSIEDNELLKIIGEQHLLNVPNTTMLFHQNSYDKGCQNKNASRVK